MEIKRFDDFIICPIPAESELDQVEIEKIVAHTRNTWQHDRQNGEMRENTIQGKRAEIVIENILNDNSTSRFLAYDKIRRDNFNKHAPFDGIIYRKDISANILQSAIDKVNNDVINSGGNTGIITVDTRKYMERNSIYTIEIKSSLLRYPRDYRCINGDVEVTRSNDNYIRLCEYVKNYYDYFVYPHFCRDNQNITSFYDYTRYVRDINNINPLNKQAFVYSLMKQEFDNACDIYTRVFFDLRRNEILVPGYIVKTRFFEEPRIRKMPSPKSKNAIYYMYHMQYGKSILKIDHDEDLLSWNRFTAYPQLFCANIPNCPYCGKRLRMVEAKGRNNKFLYVCDWCPKEYKWTEITYIYRTNR